MGFSFRVPPSVADMLAYLEYAKSSYTMLKTGGIPGVKGTCLNEK